jgi:uncharacterized phage infection (PIP) family protein YhgE
MRKTTSGSYWLTALVVLAFSTFAFAQATKPAAAPAAPAATADDSGKVIASAAPVTDEQVKTVADRLLDEAERQHTVNRRMDASVTAFDSLIRDLLSNDLLARGNGAQMKRFVEILGVLNIRHVPNAEKYLQEARKRLEAIKPNVTAADGEIQVIVKMLDDLLKKAEANRSEDDLLTQLRLIIRNQEAMGTQTREWGKLLYSKPTEAEAPREDIRARQQQIAASVRQFEDRLNDAAKNETEPARKLDLDKASTAMKEYKIDKTLDKAAEDVSQKKPVPAVEKQADGLEKLRLIEKLLQATDQQQQQQQQVEEMKDARQQLQDILEKQEKLTQKTRQEQEKTFPEKAKQLQVEQHNLKKELEKAKQDMPEAADPEVKKPVEKAEEHMQEAAKDLEKTEQNPAVKEQEKAEEALKEALKKLDEQIAKAEEKAEEMQQNTEETQQLEQAIEQTQSLAKRQEQLKQQTEQTPAQNVPEQAKPQQQLSEEAKEAGEEHKEAGEKLEEAAKEMHEAAKDMEKGEKPEAGEHQQKALDALHQATEQLQHALQQHQQQQQHQAQPHPNEPNQPNQQPPDKIKPTKENKSKEKGKREFGNQKGGKVDDDKKLWDKLTQKEREALKQRFAGELPLEYRELLEDYYEALSK